jgi:hypothetical protein
MRTTTIRVDAETHATRSSSRPSPGKFLITTRAAAEALRRQRFAQHVTEELHALRADPEAWAEYLADAERSSVSDGVA